MNITPVNSAQKHFNGYVDKSVTRILTQCVKNSSEELIQSANLMSKDIDYKQIRSLQEKAEVIMTRLNKFMKNFHPQTALTVENIGTKYQRLGFRNDKLKQTIELYPHSPTNATCYNYSIGIRAHDPVEHYTKHDWPRRTITHFEDYTLILFSKLNPQKAEELLLQKYIDTTKNKLKSSFWQRLLTNFKIKRATNFATECNIIKNTPEEINKYKNGLKKEFLQTRSIKNR